MKSFRTIFARDLDSLSIKSEMETYGYVFIRDLMPKGGELILVNMTKQFHSGKGKDFLQKNGIKGLVISFDWQRV